MKTDQPVFRLFGYAGTGKTTLAKHVATSGRTLFCAYTGKAAYVLQQKGCEAFTIHKLIYTPKEKSQLKLRELMDKLENTEDKELRDSLEQQIEVEQANLKAPHFVLNQDSEVKRADLVVVDECSMVNQQMAEDLLSFGTKVLVLGDPAQLPPVYGTGWFINAKPDFMLTEIHRQAKGNPIIDLATKIRRGDHLSPDGGMLVPWGSVSPKEVMTYDQILVGTNATKRATNNKVRALRGCGSDLPVENDRVVCLRNNHEACLLNGSIWVVDQCLDTEDKYIDLVLKDPEGVEYVAVTAHKHHFLDRSGKSLPPWVRKEAEEFEFGFAMTVHKSQGSQWDSVIVFDESRVFNEQDRSKWLYTAVTRAAKKVKVVLGG